MGGRTFAALAIAAAAVLAPGCVAAPEMPPEPPRLFDGTVPRDVEEAVALLAERLSLRDRTDIVGMSEREFAKRWNYQQIDAEKRDLGWGIRHHWGLYTGSPLRDFFRKRGIEEPELMSAMVLTSLWRRLRGEPIRLEEQIDCCRRWSEAYAKIVSEARAWTMPELSCPHDDCEVHSRVMDLQPAPPESGVE